MTPEERRNHLGKSNRRLGLVLLSVALVFGVGFVSKIILFGF